MDFDKGFDGKGGRPADWDGGPVLMRNGRVGVPEDAEWKWGAGPIGYEQDYDIVQYNSFLSPYTDNANSAISKAYIHQLQKQNEHLVKDNDYAWSIATKIEAKLNAYRRVMIAPEMKMVDGVGSSFEDRQSVAIPVPTVKNLSEILEDNVLMRELLEEIAESRVVGLGPVGASLIHRIAERAKGVLKKVSHD